MCLPGAYDGSPREDDEHGKDTADEHTVPPRKLPHLVRHTGWPCGDRFVVRMAPQIGGQFRSRRISTLTVFFDSLRDYRLDVAPVCAVDGAKRRRLLLANHV